MSVRDYLLDAMTRRQIMVQRFANHEIATLEDVFAKLASDLSAAIIAGTSDAMMQYRSMRVLSYIDESLGEAIGTVRKSLTEQLELLAQDEVEFTTKAMQHVVRVDLNVPSSQLIIASVRDANMVLVTGDTVRRLTVNDMLAEFEQSKSREIGTTIRAGVIQGRTTPDIARDVSRMVKTRTKRQATTIVRTAVNSTATRARQETLSANADILEGVRWISTLDARTSELCMGRDQKIYPVDSGPRPPAHFACRSTVVPEVNDEYTIPGMEGERASMHGPVDAKTTYNSWLKRQPAAFQDEVLGATKAKLFRSGGLHVDKFTDDMGISYNIDQLRRLHPLAFERAGID